MHKSIDNQNNSLKKKITKSAAFSAFTSALLAIALGLIVGLIVMLVANPGNAFAGFSMILFGGVGSLSRIGNVLYFATPIMMTGLAVGFAFKMGLFNIGASGQFTMGMFFAMYVGFMWKGPTSLHWIACVVAGMVGGLLWGIIPGIFKALLNVNEVITCIMFNYIGMYLVDMLVQSSKVMYDPSTTRTTYLPGTAQIPSLNISGSNANISFFIAIVIAIILYVVLNKTTFGYELKATGFNKHAAQYAGMNGKRNIISTMSIAGALAGMGGAFSILAPAAIANSSMTYEPINVIAGTGFTGIAVALLGASSPIGTIFSAIFISHIQRGGTLTSLYGFKPEIVDIVIAVIIYFAAFSMIMKATLNRFFKNRRDKLHEVKSVSTEIAPETTDKPVMEDIAELKEVKIDSDQTEVEKEEA